ncbi:MAG: PIG-L family deacetylase [Thermoguttaceae bacterium]
MSRWRLFVFGIFCGLVLAGSLGFARLAMKAPASPGDGAPTTPAAAAGGEPAPPEDGKLRVIAFGAHPDDCEEYAGGTACLWSDLGHHVKFVSATNGDIGHFQIAGGPLARRRAAEVQAAAKVLGNVVQVLDIHDGELMPTLENRRAFTRLIRHWNADIVISHRPNDYHPDHRYTGVLVQDCAYMVGVPFFCPDAKPLTKNPAFLYACDGFQKPNPFRADIVVSIDTVIERKLEALAQIVSQTIEGGCDGDARSLPRDGADLKARQERFRQAGLRQTGLANRFRDKLIELYGEEAGRKVRYAEAFEVCEYGRRPTADELRKLFPFAPPKN